MGPYFVTVRVLFKRLILSKKVAVFVKVVSLALKRNKHKNENYKNNIIKH